MVWKCYFCRAVRDIADFGNPCSNCGGHTMRNGEPMHNSDGAYEIEAHNVQQFTHEHHDVTDQLWPMVQDLKRLADRIKGLSGLDVVLMKDGQPISLEFFLTLKDE